MVRNGQEMARKRSGNGQWSGRTYYPVLLSFFLFSLTLRICLSAILRCILLCVSPFLSFLSLMPPLYYPLLSHANSYSVVASSRKISFGLYRQLFQAHLSTCSLHSPLAPVSLLYFFLLPPGTGPTRLTSAYAALASQADAVRTSVLRPLLSLFSSVIVCTTAAENSA